MKSEWNFIQMSQSKHTFDFFKKNIQPLVLHKERIEHPIIIKAQNQKLAIFIHKCSNTKESIFYAKICGKNVAHYIIFTKHRCIWNQLHQTILIGLIHTFFISVLNMDVYLSTRINTFAL